MDKVLLTGITGLVGSAFTVDLFKNNADAEIVAFTRSRMNISAKERVEAVIKEQCEFDGVPELTDRILKNLTVIDYDTTEEVSKVPFDLLKGVNKVFHCAADVNLGKDVNGATFNCNYGGTKSMLEIAKKLDVEEFHYVSTAYVAGQQSGLIPEGKPDHEITFNNAYEESKFLSEQLVRDSGLTYNIYRPGIIVGRISDGRIRRPIAFYRLCEFIAKIKKRQCGKYGLKANDPIFLPIRLEATISNNVYFVPIDYVHNTITKLYLKSKRNREYHITGRGPATITDIEKALCGLLSIEGLTVVEKIENPIPEEKLMEKYIGDLLPYFSAEMIFDVSNVIEELGEENLDWKFDYDALSTIIGYYYETRFPEVLAK